VMPREASAGATALRIEDFDEPLSAALAPFDPDEHSIDRLEESVWALGEASAR